ncbi:hypothetical protein [Streptomyces sp. enrichment culture]|uniref:hypothetical protein n=1 Tax=Streptomyces sp. enrichment culture TaxID=1795815 RepID=UPI003F546DEE
MTDVAPEQTTEDEQDWSGPTAGETYPSFPDNPHNHRYTISFDGRGPMVVVRGNTAQEIADGFTELMNEAVGATMGNAWAALKAAAAVASGLGATPVPNGAPAAPQAPTPPPFGPNVSVPGAPGYQGPPVPQGPGVPANFANPGGHFGAPPAPGGFGGGQQQNTRGPKPRPADWPQVYKVTVPFAQKDAFKALREQHKDVLRGKVAWAGAGDYWIHGEVVSGFAAYNPVPA